MGGSRPGHLAVPVAYWVVRWPLRRRWVDEHDAKIKQASRGATPRDAPGGPMKLAENRSGWSHAHGRRHTTLASRCGRGLEELKSSPNSTTVRRPRAERCVSFERHQYQHLHELMHEWVGSWICRKTRRRCACRPVRR